MRKLFILLALFLLSGCLVFAADIKLILLRQNGKPVANAPYRCGLISGANGGQTDRNGRSTLQNMEDTAFKMLIASPGNGYAVVTVPQVSPNLSIREVTARLKKGGTISGRVQLADGRAVGGLVLVPFRVGGKDQDFESMWGNLFGDIKEQYLPADLMASVSRDDDGSFKLSALPPGSYNIVVGKPEITRLKISIAGSNTKSGVKVIVPKPSGATTLSGRLLGPNGKPLAHTDLRLIVRLDQSTHPNALDWVPRRVRTDADGRFTLFPIVPDRYWITASVSGFRPGDRQTVVVPAGGASGVVCKVK